MSRKIVIAELEFDTDGAVQAQANLLAKITELKSAQSDLRKETKNLKDANDDQRKSYVDIENQLSKLNAEYRENKKIIDESTVSHEELNKVMTKEIKTKRDAIKNNKELRQIQAGVNAETEEGQKLIKEINKKLEQNTEFIKENSDAYVKQKMNIGAYTDSILAAGDQLNIMGLSATKVGKSVIGFGSNVTTGSKAVNALRLGALSLVAIPLVALFSGLAVALTSTQDGMDFVNKTMSQLSAISGVVVERIGALGKAVLKVLKGDFSGAAEEAGKAFKSGFVDEIEAAIEEGGAVAELEKANKRLNNDSIKYIAKLEKQSAILQQIAGDSTISLQAQYDAAIEAGEAEVKLSDERIKMAKRDLDEFQRVSGLKAELNADDRRTIAELTAAVTAAESEKAQKVLENATLIRQIDQDTFEQRLDYLIDGFDNFKTVQERMINMEGTSADERTAILNNLQNEYELNFQQQKELFQTQSKEYIDFNALLAEEDANLLYERIAAYEMSEIENQRLLEVVREHRTFEQDMVELTTDVIQKNLEDRLELQGVYLETSQTEQTAALQAELQELENHKVSIFNIAKAEAEGLRKIDEDRINKEYDMRVEEIEGMLATEELKSALLKQATVEKNAALQEVEQEYMNSINQIQIDEFEDKLNTVRYFADRIQEILDASHQKELDKIESEKEAINAKYDAQAEAAAGNAELVAQIEENRQQDLAALEEQEVSRIEAYNEKIDALNKARLVTDVLQGVVKGFAQGGIVGGVASMLMGIALLEANGIPAGLGLFAIPKAAKRLLKRLLGDDVFGDGGGGGGGGAGQTGGAGGGGGGTTGNNQGGGDNSSEDNQTGGGKDRGYFKGTPYLEGAGHATSDSIPILAARGEAIIPTSRNLQYLGLSEAMINGNVGEWFMHNYLASHGNFSDRNIVSGLDKLRGAVASNKPVVVTKQVSMRDELNARARTARKYGNLK